MTEFREALQKELTGTYALERELGGGAMSRVWLATETALDRRVVLKVLSPELAHAVSADRFRQEIRLAARLSHPHIVPLLAAGTAGEHLFYTMPFIEGRSLRARLEERGELPVRDAVHVLRGVASALAYAHERGIVHRDIKPDNVLLTGDEALVADFGIAKALVASATATGGSTGMTTRGIALGTPAYIAPEQAAADPLTDHRADIYAWGCMAYECLTGQPPFAGRPMQALLAAHATESPDPLGRRRASVPPALAALVDRCLEKRPADRPQRADELVAALQALDTTAAGATSTQRVTAPTRRVTHRVMIAGGIALFALAATGTALFARRRPKVAPSASVIAILPFVPASADTALARLGRELVVTIGTNLDGVGEIRSVDALTILSQVRASDAVPNGQDALALARRLGARSVLSGTLLRTGDLVRADLSLADEGRDEPLARISVSTPAGDVAALTDSITWSLLRQVWQVRGAPTPSIAAVTTHSVPALRAFLEGERLATEGRYHEAAEAFSRAIATDSTFWLAYVRKESSLIWFLPIQHDSLAIARYREHRFELPERERLLIEADMADSAGEGLRRLQALVARYPDFWAAQWRLADLLMHYGGFLGRGYQEAQAALERTVALNPNLVAAWGHLLPTTIRNKDSIAVRKALTNVARMHSDETAGAEPVDFHNGTRLTAYALVAPDSAAALVDSALQAIPNPRESLGDRILFIPLYHGLPQLQVAYSRRALQRSLPSAGIIAHERFLALAWAARGAWDSALVSLDRSVGRDPTAPNAMFRYRQAVLAAWLGAIEPEEAARRRPANVADSAEVHAELAWLDGMIAYTRKDAAGIERARSVLRTLRATGASDLDRSLGAFAADLRGERARAATELAVLESERAQLDRSADRYLLLCAIDRLAAVRWFAGGNEPDRARELIRWNETDDTGNIPWIFANMPLAGPAYFEEARLQQARGRTEEARNAYRRFLKYYDQPDARMAHLVDEARSALARLSQEPGAR